MDDATYPVTGGCLCGAVQYEITASPDKVGSCHCRMCQRWSGSAFTVGARFAAAAVRFTKAEPKFYRSSAIMERGACGACGSPLVYRYLVEGKGADKVWISLGTLDRPDLYAASYHYGVETEMRWLHDDLPRHRLDEDSNLTAAFQRTGETT